MTTEANTYNGLQFGLDPNGMAKSVFSVNYTPATVNAFAANPNADIAGATAPTANKLADLQPTSNSSSTATNTSTSVSAPKLSSYSTTYNNGQQQNQQQPSSNLGSTLLQNGASKLGNIGTGIGTAIDNFGMGFGFGAGATGAITEGGATEAISAGLAAADPSLLASGAGAVNGAFGGATLSGVLGAAGLGFVGGGMLASFIGGNPLGGSIGGAIGAGAGMAFGAAGAAALGLELGAWAGPLGALVGGIGGAVFGSLFGNSKPATQAANFGGNLNADGSYAGTGNSGFKGGNTAVSGAQGDLFTNLAQAAHKDLGLNFNTATAIQTGYNTLHSGGPTPYFINVDTNGPKDGVDGTRYFFDPKSSASVDAAYKGVLLSAFKSSGYADDQATLDKVSKWYDANVKGGALSKNTSDVSNVAPSLPNNPRAAQEQTDWQKFLADYRTSQNANAAPTPTATAA